MMTYTSETTANFVSEEEISTFDVFPNPSHYYLEFIGVHNRDQTDDIFY